VSTIAEYLASGPYADDALYRFADLIRDRDPASARCVTIFMDGGEHYLAFECLFPTLEEQGTVLTADEFALLRYVCEALPIDDDDGAQVLASVRVVPGGRDRAGGQPPGG
jgi:hypothetical protein